MPLPDLAANTVVLVSFIGNCSNQRIINTFHYRARDAGIPGTQYSAYLDTLFTELTAVGALLSKFRAAMPANYTIEEMRIQPVFPTRQRYISYPLVLSGTWPVDLNSMQNIAASIKRVTNKVGPAGVGRIQVVPPDGQTFNGSFVNVNGYITALQDLGNTFLDNLTTAAPGQVWIPVLFGPGYAPGTLNDLVNWQVETTVRTMHRRTTFLGE